MTRPAAACGTTMGKYHNVQPDVLETFLDRGQLRKLAEPTILPSGKRIPGLKLDHPRPLAVMHALVRFSPMAAGGSFTTADLYAPALDALGLSESRYTLASFRYMTYPSCAPKAWSRRSRTRVVMVWSAKATRFAWPSSNGSRKSTRP